MTSRTWSATRGPCQCPGALCVCAERVELYKRGDVVVYRDIGREVVALGPIVRAARRRPAWRDPWPGR